MKRVAKEDTLGLECRFAVFCPPPPGHDVDLHLIKEVAHTKDGVQPQLNMVRNFPRTFYVTNKAMQNHEQKKEWESIDNLKEYTCTQSQLTNAVSKALGRGPFTKGDPRRLYDSPYVYGADISSSAIIKQRYRMQYPDHITPYSMSAFDVETDVLHGTDEIIMATLSFKERVVTAVKKSFFNGHSDVTNRLHEAMDRYLGEIKAKRGINWEVVLVDDEIGIVEHCFKRAHEWMPDWVAIWNIDFDIQKLIQACTRAGVDPKYVFSAPEVPDAYKFFTYKQGSRQKKTASGKITPRKPHEQWHSALCPASFSFMDAMCAYKQIRTGAPEEPSYGLSAILEKHLGIRKLNFKEAEGMANIDWHKFMQENYPFEYVIYNVFDCVGMEMLDEETKDLQFSLPMFAGCSDFSHFNSQPRRTVDNLHFFVQKFGYMIGTTASQMKTEFDDMTLDLRNWIVMLPAHLVADNGMRLILENPYLATNIRAHVGDLDVEASYPVGEAVFNVSQSTTRCEVTGIEGVDEITQRRASINLSAGHTNATEIACAVYKLPTLETMLEKFQQRLATQQQVA